jgi:predicted nucleic acid-binding Zn ribbon protein
VSVVRNKSPYERRIRELEKERELLQRNIKSVAKNLSKSGVDPVEAAERMARLPPPREYQKPPEPSLSSIQLQSLPTAREVPAQHFTAPPREPAAAASVSAKVVSKDERFASYFSSGSFGKAGPLSHERKVQRNRAIFMILVVALVAFLVYKFMA